MAPSSRMNLASLLQSDDEPRRPPPALPPPPAPYPPSEPAPSYPIAATAKLPAQPELLGVVEPIPTRLQSAPAPVSKPATPPAPSARVPPAAKPQLRAIASTPAEPIASSLAPVSPALAPARAPPRQFAPAAGTQPPTEPLAPGTSSPPPRAPRSWPPSLASRTRPPPDPRPPTLPRARDSYPPTPDPARDTTTRPGLVLVGGWLAPGPIIPLNSTPAPRSPVHYTAGASRSPTAPYPIYGAGGRRSPEFTASGQPPMGAPSSSSSARRNTLTSAPSGPQAIEPVPLRDYPPYPNSGSAKHPDDGSYPPAFSAPVYGSRPQSPQTQTGNKARRSGGGSGSIASRSTGTKRSVGGAGELKRPANERGRDSEKDEREMDKEREEHAHRERERERDREREREQQERSRERREYEETRAVRERERQVQHEMEMRRAPTSKRPVGLESEFARRQPSASDWDRPRERDRDREHRDRDRRVPREQERDWRREEEEARQGAPALVQSKHLPPISAHGGYAEKQSHMHSHSHSIPSLQQSRPHAHSHVHHYAHSHPRAASPPPLSHSLPPLLPPTWLGTYVFPNIPFPVRLPPALSRNNLSSEGYKPYQYSILVPTGFLPIQPPSRSPRPDVPLWGSPHTGYTDDSDILLAAVHSNKTTWSDIRRARRLKQDVKITVGVWAGGANGGRNATRPKGGAWEGVPGGGQLHSSSWGNTHDGGGMEIVEVVWMDPGSAHAPHRPNRRERMDQYAKRRADLELVPPAKRDRIDTWYLDSDEEDESATIPTKRGWDVGETIVFGKGGASSGFVYDPHTLRSVVFEESNERSTKRLRTKDGSEKSDARRDIVLENDDEQYILTLKHGEDEKTRKYTLSTLSPKSKKTEVLRKSLTEEDVSFFDKGLCVWLKDGAESKLVESTDKDKMDTGSDAGARAEDGADGDRKGWFCHVSRWKFVPDDLKDGVQA